MGFGSWHYFFYSAALGEAATIYYDGLVTNTFTTAQAPCKIDDRLSLNPDGISFFNDNASSGNYPEVTVSDIVIWDAALSQQEILDYFKLRKLDQTGFRIASVFTESTPTYAATNMLTTVLTSYWHTINSGTGIENPPYYAILDMYEPKTIGRIQTFRRYSTTEADTKTVQWYAGNSSDPNGSWTLIGEDQFGNINANQGGTLLTIDAPAGGVTGRFLKVVLPDTWKASGHDCNISRIYVYEVVQ
jgi:hypothetical protein